MFPADRSILYTDLNYVGARGYDLLVPDLLKPEIVLGAGIVIDIPIISIGSISNELKTIRLKISSHIGFPRSDRYRSGDHSRDVDRIVGICSIHVVVHGGNDCRWGIP